MAARKHPPIKTVSYCYVNGVKTCTDDLTPTQQQRLGSEIQRILAENLFLGQKKKKKAQEQYVVNQ